MGFFKSIGNAYKKAFNLSKSFSKSGKKAPTDWRGEFWANEAPSGTGLAFLSSLNLGGKSGLTIEQMASNPYGGSAKQNYSPAVIAQWLKGEMGPGGLLGGASQTRKTAVGMGEIIAGGERDVQDQERALAAYGVAQPALSALRSANRSVMSDRARGYLVQRTGEQDEQRYDAMEGYMNMLVQTVAATKNQQLNYAMAKKSASATKQAGIAQGLGNLIGGIFPG